MTRRLTALLLGLVLLLSPLCLTARAEEITFSDVPERHWAHDEILRAAHVGLIQGVGKGRFGLGETMNRAQYATLLCRFMGWELLSPAKGSFSDNQNPNSWYYSVIETAFIHGALFITPGSACHPYEAITREEMSTSLVRALGYQSLSGIVQDDCPFTDVVTNRGYIALAYRMGLVRGVGERAFDPSGTCTREQAACVLLRTYDRMDVELVSGGSDMAPADAVEAAAYTGDGTPVPLSPRAPLETVYAAAVEAGSGGAVLLHTAPFAQRVKDGQADEGRVISQAQLDAYLANKTTQVYRSARYESSYLIHPEADGSSTVVWYETSTDLTEKLDLCRLLGVTGVFKAD